MTQQDDDDQGSDEQQDIGSDEEEVSEYRYDLGDSKTPTPSSDEEDAPVSKVSFVMTFSYPAHFPILPPSLSLPLSLPLPFPYQPTPSPPPSVTTGESFPLPTERMTMEQMTAMLELPMEDYPQPGPSKPPAETMSRGKKRGTKDTGASRKKAKV